MAEIAAITPLKDIRQLRLVNRWCAATTFPILARHLSVLNVISSLTEFKRFLRTIPTVFTKKLTIYNGKWPTCSRQEWESHPLLLYEKHPRLLQCGNIAHPSDILRDSAFINYRDFLSNERGRTHKSDVEVMKAILNHLPNINTIVLEGLQPWSQVPLSNLKLSTLRSGIWIPPTFNGTMDRILRCVVDSLDPQFTVQVLDVRGKLRIPTFNKCLTARNLASLRIQSLLVDQTGLQGMPASTENFNCLKHLDLGFLMNPITNLDSDHLHLHAFPYLESIRFIGLVVEEESLFQMIAGSPKLNRMALFDVTLARGDWKSLLTRIRKLKGNLSVTLGGILSGLDPHVRISLRGEAGSLLGAFMANDVSWPFDA
ncbi:hypothetical protein F5Y06DRAFT_305431 [Hypoxylon sp. FL0890]|nr:hypothetical protein F5Y06DRAFT_305431 [Hypoxylon sp. FL0890]